MIERLVIEGLAHRGDGVAQTPTGPVFVPYALPGETVEVEPVAGQPDRRHLVRIETPSPERIAPVCPHFGVCGGCAMQHWTTAPYRAWKRDLVVAALRQAGLDATVEPLIDAHGDGRRRATFHSRLGANGATEVGFAAQRTHQIIGIDRCPVLAPSMKGALETARAVAEALQSQRKPLDIQVTATHEGLDVDVRGSGPLDTARLSSLARVAEMRHLARLTRHGELVAQRAVPTLTMGRARVALPAGGFIQATATGEAALAQRVQAHVGDAKLVADLFCGIGPFALRLAERARIVAVDQDATAVAALKHAAANARGLKPVDAQARDLFRGPLTAAELNKVSAVVFDPPRQGAEAQARELAQSKVPVIVAVSCNAATFARDARILTDGGYRLDSVTPVDQFRYSAHVEIVARLTRRRAANG